MAGLCGLKILLLWAGIISLANCQDAKAPMPPHSTTNPHSPSVTNLSDISSTPRTMTTATVMPSDPPLTQSPLSTNSSIQAPSPTAVSVTTTPANISHSPTATSTKPDSQPNPNQNQTSPPIITPTNSVTTTAEATSQAPTPPQCSYTFKSNKSRLLITITSSATANHNITIQEKGHPNTTKTIFNVNSSFEIEHLKPCTSYKHDVTFTDDAGKQTSCNCSRSKVFKTTGMREEDIENGIHDSERVCYKSDWDISSLLYPADNIKFEPQNDNKTFCITPAYDDICSDLKINFTSGNCVNSSFTLTENITVDFLKSQPIYQPVPRTLPAEIKPTLPKKCENLTWHYTCVESEGQTAVVEERMLHHEFKNLSELEPYKNYSCTGQIKYNNTFLTETTAVHVRVDCDFKIATTMPTRTNTSIKLSWTTTSEKCQTVLPKLHKLSYHCECKHASSRCGKYGPINKNVSGTTCNVSGLAPYTNYTCEVHPTYDSNRVHGQGRNLSVQTEIGVPEPVTKLSVTVANPDHNAISVICVHNKCFKGPESKYVARLLDGSNTEITSDTCSFEFKDLSYSTTYNVEVTAFNGENKSKPETKEIKTEYNDKALIGFLVFLIILTSVALLMVVYKIYILKRRKSNDSGESMMLISTANDEENLLPVEPIAAEVLLEAYKRKLADEGRLFLAEFQSIPRIFSRYNVKEAKKPYNVPKNRYVDILPYDYNRVQLTSGNGEAGCDYINASFIDGYKESKKYIAAQGPKDETVGDFWRMVWEQQSSIIVMVTRCEEGNRLKCAQYWPSPDRETEIFQEFIVKLNSENHCPDYTIRHLILTNKREKNSEREVTHIQFMSWPDHGVPGDPHLLLKLRRRVNAFKNFFSGPIVVHCSAGVGRTGTYIGIDAMMEGLEAEGRVDIYGYVVRLRRQRCLMVQVEAQYILIHQALLEHNQFGETEIILPELHSTLSTLKQKNSSSEPTLMEDEFDRLPTYRNWRTFNAGITDDNKRKNRSSSVIPYDYNRVLLKLDEGHSRDSDPDEDEEEESSDEEDEESTKYINASHIDGYWGPRTFITAQTPLPDTMADFWSMVYQKKVSAIVMLSDCSEGDEESDCVYWDKDKKVFGDFEVELVSTDTSPAFISRNMLLRHVKRKDSRTVKHFQFLKWAGRELPEKPQDLTDMIKDLKRSCGSSKSQRGTPIVVHCNDGSTRSGIFCALWNLLDSGETEKLVDVFQVVKTLRKERQGMFSSLEQYQFLYDALEMVFPVQNGEVKAVQTSAAVQIVDETKAAKQPAEEKAEEPASTTSKDQQGAAESAPTVADGEKEDRKEEPEKVSSSPTETTPLEDASNGPGVTVEV
ncbi:receptor-type tyrosine-protein phosphatase C [Chaetodon auriga]|uniref:receptor-type tyrosine-protein phosphatase C n=1 Tax=Chaetodon auriga TaxID=39042 RepID=UPI00403314D5